MNVVTFGTIECYNGITTYRDIICNALTATNIYTNTEINNLLTPKATTAYVDHQLDLKSNQATTYTKTEVDNLLTPKATVTYVNEQLALNRK